MQVIHTSSNGHSSHRTSDRPLNTKSAEVSDSVFTQSKKSSLTRESVKRIKVTAVPPNQTQIFMKQFQSLLNIDADHADYENQVQTCCDSLQKLINDEKLEKLDLCPLLEELGNIDTDLFKCIKALDDIKHLLIIKSATDPTLENQYSSFFKFIGNTQITLCEYLIPKLSKTTQLEAVQMLARCYIRVDSLGFPGNILDRGIACLDQYRQKYLGDHDTYMQVTRYMKDVYEGNLKRASVIKLYERLPENIKNNPCYTKEIQNTIAENSGPFVVKLEEKTIEIFLPANFQETLEEKIDQMVFAALRSIDSKYSIFTKAGCKEYYRYPNSEPGCIEREYDDDAGEAYTKSRLIDKVYEYPNWIKIKTWVYSPKE